MEILGISDLSPDDTKLSIQVRDNRGSDIQNNLIATENINERTMSTRATNQIKNYTNYRVYFSDNEPNNTNDLLGGAYETTSGTYMYKYSYAYDNNYLCSTEVQFSNTQLKCGTEIKGCMLVIIQVVVCSMSRHIRKYKQHHTEII